MPPRASRGEPERARRAVRHFTHSVPRPRSPLQLGAVWDGGPPSVETVSTSTAAFFAPLIFFTDFN